MGGTYTPEALYPVRIVVVWPRSALVADETHRFPLGAKTLTGLCTHVKLLSSQLNIWCG